MPYRYKQPGNWKTTRRRILRRDANLCPCGAIATQVDHVIPVMQGGGHDDANLRAICSPCHAAKSSREAVAGRQRSSPARPTPLHPGLLR